MLYWRSRGTGARKDEIGSHQGFVPDNGQRGREVITSDSARRMPKQARLQDKAEIDDDAMPDATNCELFQEDENQASSCRTYYAGTS